jgi:hypothetical protein
MAIKGYVLDLSDVTEYPSDPQIDLNFYANTTTIVSDHPSAVIFATLGGDADDTSVNGARVAGIQLQSPIRKLWLRREDVPVEPATVIVRVTCESAPE